MEHEILAAVADGVTTAIPGKPAGRGSKRRRDTLEFGVKLLFLLCGCVAVGCVLFICVYLIIAGLPAVLEIGITDFLFGTEWAGKQGQFGILPFILTSVAGTAGAVLVGVPVGILTAMFLAKVAPPKAARVIRAAVELLAGIPSIVYGLVGMIVLVPAIQRTFQLASGATLLAAIVVLAVMILPSIINVAETALKAVPGSMRRPAWPWAPLTSRPSSASPSPRPAPAWPRRWCWGWGGPSARRWPSSWCPAMCPICPRASLPRCVSSPPPSPLSCPTPQWALSGSRPCTPWDWSCSCLL